MTEYAFEIVPRRFDRYSWLLVERDDGRRRVLLRAERDFRSKRRVRKAINRLQEIVDCSPVVDATGAGAEPFPLPNRYFTLRSDVVPLVVDESPVDVSQSGIRRRARTAPRPAGARSDEPAAGDGAAGTEQDSEAGTARARGGKAGRRSSRSRSAT